MEAFECQELMIIRVEFMYKVKKTDLSLGPPLSCELYMFKKLSTSSTKKK